jgi:hypothetical protein
LNALLRIKDGPNAKPLVEFLDLEKAKALVVKSSMADHRATLTTNVPKTELSDQDKVDLTTAVDGDNAGGNNLSDWEAKTGHKPVGGDSATTTPPKPSAGVRAGGQSLMDAAEQNAANSTSNQQEKWRKLFYQMRIKLKPKDIAVSSLFRYNNPVRHFFLCDIIASNRCVVDYSKVLLLEVTLLPG